MANKTDTKFEKEYVSPTTIQGIEDAFNMSSYGTDNPNYQEIAVAQNVKNFADDGTFIGAYPYGKFINNPKLDSGKNTSVGTGKCELVNLCVPSISVPADTKALADEIKYDSQGNIITPEDKELAKEVKKIADTIDDLKDYEIPPYFSIDSLKSEFKAPKFPHNREDYLNSLTKSTIPLTTQESVACRPETEAIIPDISKTDLDNPELKDIMDKLDDLLNEDTSVLENVAPVDNAKLTERKVDGHGTFDWIASALMNQLSKAVNDGLINKSEVRDIYAKGIQTTLQTSASFLVENEQAFWANLAQKNNMEIARVQALMAKAELAMMPLKVKLEYARLQTELRKLEIIQYQAEQEKFRIPQIVAQTDQIREQTALICQQRKHAVEQLAQAELDRKLKQAQIDMARIQHEHEELKLHITQEQVVQSKEQTKQMIAQTKQLLEQTKLTYAQTLNALKDVKLKDARLIQMKAELKLRAQELIRENERIALTKAQTATAYANITVLAEQIKAAKAQYSDTIDGAEIGGTLGAQIAVNKAQAMGFERDSFYKFFSQIQSGWSAKKTSDIATLSPNAFNALGVDRVINWYAQKYFNMPNDIFDMPDTYRDFLSDEEMEGTAPTPSTGDSKVDTAKATEDSEK